MLVKLVRDGEESFHNEGSESIERFLAAGWKAAEAEKVVEQEASDDEPEGAEPEGAEVEEGAEPEAPDTPPRRRSRQPKQAD